MCKSLNTFLLRVLNRFSSFRFNVDIEDGAPPLKLPFNKIEDPWVAAQAFIHKNDLPQVYLEQVANFIITNANLTSLPPAGSQADFADPFTGEGRYIPGGSTVPGAPAVNVNFRERSENNGNINMDPFTGGDSYSSGRPSTGLVKKHIPYTQLTTFDVYDASKILAKLKEFNGQVDDAKVDEHSLTTIVGVVNGIGTGIGVVIDYNLCAEIIDQLFQWPNDKLFPVLDVIRLIVRNPEACKMLYPKTLDSIIKNLTSTPANQLMSTRALCNITIHPWGKQFVATKIHDICEQIAKIALGNANLQIAVATFYLNQSILQKEAPSNELCTTLTIGAIKFLEWSNDNESTFRAYQALGNLIVYNPSAVLSIIKSLDQLKNALERNRNASHEKLAEISLELTEKLL